MSYIGCAQFNLYKIYSTNANNNIQKMKLLLLVRGRFLPTEYIRASSKLYILSPSSPSESFVESLGSSDGFKLLRLAASLPDTFAETLADNFADIRMEERDCDPTPDNNVDPGPLVDLGCSLLIILTSGGTSCPLGLTRESSNVNLLFLSIADFAPMTTSVSR